MAFRSLDSVSGIPVDQFIVLGVSKWPSFDTDLATTCVHCKVDGKYYDVELSIPVYSDLFDRLFILVDRD